MSRTLVVCDDDGVARKVIGNLAAQSGYDVVAEADLAVRAVDMVSHYRPDVLVLDVSMPGLNGTEVISSVREACSTTAVVLISAFDLRSEVVASSGADAVIDKSELDELSNVLEQLSADAGA